MVRSAPTSGLGETRGDGRKNADTTLARAPHAPASPPAIMSHDEPFGSTKLTMRQQCVRLAAAGFGVLALGWAGCGILQEGPSAPNGGTAAAAAESRPAAPLVRAFSRYDKPTGDPYLDRFVALWNDLHDPKNGYFSAKGIPYHSAETLIVEAPDYGHETTSEAYSYWIWLEA